LLRQTLSSQQGRAAWVKIDEFSPIIPQIFIVLEDKRFCSHCGIDQLALLRAAWSNVKNRRIVSGGSTITQQLAETIYDLPQNALCKPLEALLAIRLENWLSKDEILEHYLNRIPFGNQAFGIETAAQTYFDKPASHLSLPELAYLAGLPRAPSLYDPFRHPQRALERQNQVLNRLYRTGIIDSMQLQTALQARIELSKPQRLFRAPHFSRWVLSKITIDEREILTSLDLPLQQQIEILVDDHLKNLEPYHATNAAVLVVDNRTGEIRVWIGSRDFFSEQQPGQVDGVLALRQPGSTLKPFTYGLALERGLTPSSILPDIETHAATAGGDFTVHNYDETYHGPVRLRTALACSYNVPAVRVLESLGSDLLLDRLHRAGFAGLDKPASHYGLALTLGSGEVRLFELVRAYRALATGGLVQPLRYSATSDKSDEQDNKPLFSPQVCFLLNDMLSDAAARAPAFGYQGPLNLPFPCAAKTGTSKDYRDNWTIGYTSDYTAGVWVGNFDGSPMQRVSGISGAGPLFRQIMLVLHQKKDPAPFNQPAGLIRCKICSQSGEIPGPACEQKMEEWFLASQVPQDTCSVHRWVDIDSRTDLPAKAGTLPQFVVKQKIELWPPEYTPWLVANQRSLPFRVNSLSPQATTGSLRIAFPDEGDIFKIDPILRPEYQILHLEANVSEGIDTVYWFVDDSLIGWNTHPFSRQWTLQPGEHTISLSEKDSSSADRIRIQVY